MKRPISSDQLNGDAQASLKKIKPENEETENPERKALEKMLSEKIRFKKKFVTKKPKLIMSLNDLKSFDKTFEDNDKLEWKLPQFFVQDIQRVVLFSLIGNQYRFFPRWCKILRPNHIKSVNLITINNVSELDYKLLSKKFKNFNSIFLNQKNEVNSIEFVSPKANGNCFLNEFVSVPITLTQWMKLRDQNEFKQKRNEVVKQYKELFEKLKLSKNKTEQTKTGINTSELDKIPRTSLLLNVVQMVREDYPLPFDASCSEKVKSYIYTKQAYEPVHNASPLYSIDCEMCYNVDGEMEVVWLALANENLECIYETFVKPKRPIRNYLTHITGVREEHLNDVSVSLTDVQLRIQELLPADAILCGQSLNNDLHALQMFHPYVIDTSIIFNISGNRDIKPSLRKLSAQFLGKLIQESTHNPTIDAKVSLQLVLLKLRQGLDFGDVIVNGCTNVYQDQILAFEDTDLSDVNSISKFIYQTGLNIDQNFFKVLLDNSVSQIYIDREVKNKLIPREINPHKTNDNDEAFEKLTQSLNKTKFTWTQFYVNSDNSCDLENQLDKKELKKVLKYVQEINEKSDDDSLLVVAFTGRDENVNVANFLAKNEELNLNDLNRGRCFLALKNLEIEKMEKEIKELYDTVYPGGKKDDLGVILPEEDE